MRTLAKAAAVVLTLSGGVASAQVVSAGVTVAAPTVHFEVAPPLVVVSPGVQVVEGYDEEIFFTGGWYWCRRGDLWFRTHDYRGGWVVAPHRYVPGRLYRIPPGRYRNYHYAGPRPGRYHEMRGREMRGREVGRHEMRESRAYAPRGAMVVREHGGGGGGHGHGRGR